MSHDMMQALSGSSMLSLSVGTLPAVKPGMMLDANPFASQLALMTAPETAMSGAAGAVVDGAGNTQFAMALAQAVAPVAAMSADAAAIVSDGAVAADIAALPEDASPSQIIEAVLGATSKPAPVVVQTQASIAKPGAARPAAETPVLSPIAPEALPEAVAVEEIASERPRRAAKLDTPVATADAAAPVAAPVIEPALPAAARPQATAPDAGSVRVAISASPSYGAVAVSAPASAPAPAPSSGNAPGASAASVIVPDAAQPSTPVASAPMPAATLPQTHGAKTAATAEPSPATQPVETAMAAETGRLDTAPATRGEPVVDVSHTRAPAQPAAMASQASAAPATPDANAAPAPVAQVDPMAASDAVATAAIVVPGQLPVQPQRSTVSATGQRALQAASLSARPAEALSAVLGLGDPASPVSPATFADATGIDAISAKPVETVPPAWAAALNAVTSPVTSNAAFGLTAAPAAATPGAGALETLAFDAGFVGNVETQIARLVGGGQMVRMQLMPENLGRIDIEMLAGPERDQVRITTEHDAVRDTLVQSQVRLEQDLRNNGNRTTDITVELRQQSAGTQGGAAQQQRGQSGSEAGTGRDGTQRQTATDALADSESAQRRPRDNVRYA